MLHLPHGALQPGWLRRPHSCFSAFRWSIISSFSCMGPHSPSQEHEEHSLRPNTAQCMCRGSPLARPAASHLRGLGQPSSKIKAVSTWWSQEQLQVSLLHPLFCCLCQPFPSISLCLLCLSQHLDETPGTGAAPLRLACTVRQEHVYCCSLLINTRVKAENGGKA